MAISYQRIKAEDAPKQEPLDMLTRIEVITVGRDGKKYVTKHTLFTFFELYEDTFGYPPEDMGTLQSTLWQAQCDMRVANHLIELATRRI